ncbi:hypothetical protein ACJVC5_01675 [Peredibacter sp. HCB2-198]|uniref:hypothetical protein n=1 Tax=Peredibacter sp. HCB2-198 TaxID=3383025 RepID=UPI0038B69C70
MKKLVPVLAVLSVTSAFAAEQPKHIVSFGVDGLGWAGTATVFDIDKDKNQLKDQESTESKLLLNYSYVFPTRFMLGGELGVSRETSESKFQDGTKIETEASEVFAGISLGYNFNENLFESWFIEGTLLVGSIESETKETGVADEDSDSSYSAFKVEFGKRLSFASWGIANFAYTPSIEVTAYSFDDDAKDAGLDSATQARLNLLKFDVLF